MINVMGYFEYFCPPTIEEVEIPVTLLTELNPGFLYFSQTKKKNK